MAPPRRMWRVVGDGVLALALAVVGVLGTLGADQRTAADVSPGTVGYALVVLAALALAVRRRWPAPTLAVVTVATSAYLVFGHPYGPILISLLVAVYSAARHLPVRPAATASALALLVLMAHVFVGAGDRPGLLGVVPASAWVVVPFAVGVTVRLVRESAATQRADALRRHADAERLRVAQEVHDVVAHGLAAIHMQAEITLHVLDRAPEQARTALTAIGRTSREALDELRVTLAAVRRDGADDGAGADPRAPTPGLARLDALVARMSDTGVPVRVRVEGTARSLPAAVDLAAYRVVQEALTNVLRHAGRAEASVLLAYRPRALDVEVSDTGAGPAAGGPPAGRAGGHGLTGMRERVTALGGDFSAGAGPGRGFRVRASLPLPAPAQSTMEGSP